MNKQTRTGIEWTQYTWNPVGGCHHDCQWEMPDGSVAECYAKTIAERFTSAYPRGFEHHYWNPNRLEEPLRVRQPARIFLDSMSDLMGHWVPNEQIQVVLDVAHRASWHQFQLLTKNPARLAKFAYPQNVWVGVSAPPTWMFGHRLSMEQQYRMVARTISTLNIIDASVRWMSLEPLSFDIAPLLRQHDAQLEWLVIGAATNGRQAFQPNPNWVRGVLQWSDERSIPVFFKGNLDWTPWREDFPDTGSTVTDIGAPGSPTQMNLF